MDSAAIVALEPAVLQICRDASQAILEIYRHADEIKIDTKSDESPVTQADLAANEIIEAGLKSLTPELPILAEESSMVPFEERQGWSRYWIVDPLDGTKEFIRRNDQFTINIALIENRVPVFGVVFVPVTSVAYVGIAKSGAKKITPTGEQRISIRRLNPEKSQINVVASTHHSNPETDAVVASIEAQLGPVHRQSIGSSLKFCLLAEGVADVYPRMAPTSEWDTAAAQAVLEAAGGAIYSHDFTRLQYNTKESVLNSNFLAVADTHFDWRTLLKNII